MASKKFHDFNERSKHPFVNDIIDKLNTGEHVPMNELDKLASQGVYFYDKDELFVKPRDLSWELFEAMVQCPFAEEYAWHAATIASIMMSGFSIKVMQKILEEHGLYATGDLFSYEHANLSVEIVIVLAEAIKDGRFSGIRSHNIHSIQNRVKDVKRSIARKEYKEKQSLLDKPDAHNISDTDTFFDLLMYSGKDETPSNDENTFIDEQILRMIKKDEEEKILDKSKIREFVVTNLVGSWFSEDVRDDLYDMIGSLDDDNLPYKSDSDDTLKKVGVIRKPKKEKSEIELPEFEGCIEQGVRHLMDNDE